MNYTVYSLITETTLKVNQFSGGRRNRAQEMLRDIVYLYSK